MDKIDLSNIDALIDKWRRECDDIHPANVDSMDRGQDVDDCTARYAICLLPALLEELKSYMVREQEGRETDLSRLAHAESKNWLKKLAKFFS